MFKHLLITSNNRLMGLLRIFIASANGFIQDNCYLKASALTFYTLLSVVPILAVAFGIAKGFGFEKLLENLLREKFREYDQLASQAISFAYSLLQHAQGGLIAGVGVITLFWTFLSLLNNIETTFNEIWKVKKPRTISRKIGDYFAFAVICPVFFVIASSVTVYISSQLHQVSVKSAWMETISPFFFLLLKLFPIFLSWIAFTFIYLFMPNTTVRFKAALFAGFIAGTFYQFVQSLYINSQLTISGYGAIYGSFAALPLFLIWLQISWLILLAGAEIAYFAESDRARTTLRWSDNISFYSKKKLALLFVANSVYAFKKKELPPTGIQLALKLGIPYGVTQEILTSLVDGGILSETLIPESENIGYQPAADITVLTIKQVMDVLERTGKEVYPLTQTEEFESISHQVDKLDHFSESSKSNVSLQSLPQKDT